MREPRVAPSHCTYLWGSLGWYPLTVHIYEGAQGGTLSLYISMREPRVVPSYSTYLWGSPGWYPVTVHICEGAQGGTLALCIPVRAHKVVPSHCTYLWGNPCGTLSLYMVVPCHCTYLWGSAGWYPVRLLSLVSGGLPCRCTPQVESRRQRTVPCSSATARYSRRRPAARTVRWQCSPELTKDSQHSTDGSTCCSK